MSTLVRTHVRHPLKASTLVFLALRCARVVSWGVRARGGARNGGNRRKPEGKPERGETSERKPTRSLGTQAERRLGPDGGAARSPPARPGSRALGGRAPCSGGASGFGARLPPQPQPQRGTADARAPTPDSARVRPTGCPSARGPGGGKGPGGARGEAAGPAGASEGRRRALTAAPNPVPVDGRRVASGGEAGQ